MESVRNVEHVHSTLVGSDRILPETRWISAIIVPFLVSAFIILYLLPDHTQALFAWGIQPRMSAMMLGAAYIGGAYFFVRVAANARWHWVHIGFLPVTTFATLMGIATILHWNRFNHGSLSFYAWVGLSL
jgi:peptidoglycan/LPS O-acetylase OafA/YrhL